MLTIDLFILARANCERVYCGYDYRFFYRFLALIIPEARTDAMLR